MIKLKDKFCSGWQTGDSYESKTRDFYKDEDVAKLYHESHEFSFSNLRNIPFHVIAKLELRVLTKLIDQLQPKTVIDVPCGTGKLAKIFSERKTKVFSGDISNEMLNFAKLCYSQENYTNVEFLIADAEKVSVTIPEKVDLSICLRLLHRVPTEIKSNILSDFSKTAPYLICSTGIDTTFHTVRRNVRQKILGGGSAYFYQSQEDFEAVLQENYEIVSRHWVCPYVSQEMIYLLKSNKF